MSWLAVLLLCWTVTATMLASTRRTGEEDRRDLASQTREAPWLFFWARNVSHSINDFMPDWFGDT
jgi:hypothetical protein